MTPLPGTETIGTPWRRSQIRAARHVAAVAGPVLENLLRADPPTQ